MKPRSKKKVSSLEKKPTPPAKTRKAIKKFLKNPTHETWVQLNQEGIE
jgi:hypothetical protein